MTICFMDRADLNGDSQVDLADIACFAKYYKEDARTARETRTMRITEEEIHTVSASNAEISQGTVEQLFSGAASLTLESEEAISGENPVTISAEFDSGKTMGRVRHRPGGRLRQHHCGRNCFCGDRKGKRKGL